MGTDGPGNTYAEATVPFGMVQLSPDIGYSGWDRIAGYFYPDSIITGFSHLHLSGTGAGDLYDILLSSVNSRAVKTTPENGNRPCSRFSHDNEHAEPGYYQVYLQDYQINAELTSTQRTADSTFISRCLLMGKQAGYELFISPSQYRFHWDLSGKKYEKADHARSIRLII